MEMERGVLLFFLLFSPLESPPLCSAAMTYYSGFMMMGSCCYCVLVTRAASETKQAKGFQRPPKKIREKGRVKGSRDTQVLLKKKGGGCRKTAVRVKWWRRMTRVVTLSVNARLEKMLTSSKKEERKKNCFFVCNVKTFVPFFFLCGFITEH